MRQSIRPIYDSCETGPAYHVTYRVDSRTITFQEPVDDPFVRGTVHVAWLDLLRAVFRGRGITVETIVGGRPDVVDHIMELDSNTLLPDSTRRETFDSHINERLGALVDRPIGDA